MTSNDSYEQGYLRARHAHMARVVTFLALGALALGYGLLGWRLGLTQDGRPAAGLWPTLVGLGLLASAGVAYAGERHQIPDDVPATHRRKELVAFGSLLLFVAAFAALGLLLPLLALLVVWGRWLAEESWRVTLLLGAGATTAIWLVFVHLLSVPMHLFPQ